MTIVSRFFHIRCPEKGHFKGATVFVEGDLEWLGRVTVQVSFCSRKDVFCKKTGREVALGAPKQIIPLRDLPRTLANIEEEVYGYGLDNLNDFQYSMRYFLPRV